MKALFYRGVEELSYKEEYGADALKQIYDVTCSTPKIVLLP